MPQIFTTVLVGVAVALIEKAIVHLAKTAFTRATAHAA